MIVLIRVTDVSHNRQEFHSDCWNVGHQEQSFLELPSPTWSRKTKS